MKHLKSVSLVVILLFFVNCIHAQLTVTIDKTDASCPANGSIQAHTTGGAGSMKFELRDGSSTSVIIRTAQTDSLFSNLSPGSYVVAVFDANHPSVPVLSTKNTINNNYTQLKITGTGARTSSTVGCIASTTDGFASITFSGGGSPYTLSVQSGPTIPTPVVTSSKSAKIEGLSSGSYVFSISDACGSSVATSAITVNGITNEIGPSIIGYVNSPSFSVSYTDVCGPKVYISFASGASPKWYVEYPAGSGNITSTYSGSNYAQLPYYDPTTLEGQNYTLWVEHPCTKVWEKKNYSIPYAQPINPIVDANSFLYISNNCDSILPKIQPKFTQNSLYCYPVRLTITNINTPGIYVLDSTYTNGNTDTYGSYKVPSSGTYVVRITDKNGSSYEKSIVVTAQAPSTAKLQTAQMSSCDQQSGYLSVYGISPDNTFPVTFNLLSLPGNSSPDQATYPPIQMLSSSATNIPRNLWENIPMTTTGKGTVEIVWNCRKDTMKFDVNRYPITEAKFNNATISVPTEGCSSGKANVTFSFTLTDTLGKKVSSIGQNLFVRILPASVSNQPISTSGGSITFTGLTVGKSYSFGIFTYSTRYDCAPLDQITVNIPNYGTPVIDANNTYGIVCSGSSTGDLTVVATGFPPLQYRLKMNGDADYGSWQSSNVFTGKTAGLYSVQVKDGCTNIVTQTVEIKNASSSSLITTTGDNNGVVCEGNHVTLTLATIGTITDIVWNTPSGRIDNTRTIDIPSFLEANSGTYSVTATSSGSCGIEASKELSMQVLPVVNQPDNQTICAGGNTQSITFAGNNANNTYTWTNDHPEIGLPASGTGDIASFIATNTTASSITATITVTPVGSNCTGEAKTFSITVEPVLIVNSIASLSVCSGELIDAIVFSGNKPGMSFKWTNDHPEIGLTAVGTGNIPGFVAVNNSAAPVVSTIIVSPDAPPSCSINPASFTITVNPKPVLTISPASVKEGNGDLQFELVLSNASCSQPISVNYATENGTAAELKNYIASSGTITFQPGELTKTIKITVVDNNIIEETKTMKVILSSPSANCTLATTEATGTISDNDCDRFIIQSSVNNINGATGDVAAISIALEPGVTTEIPFTIALNTSGSTAVQDVNYSYQGEAMPASVSFTPEDINGKVISIKARNCNVLGGAPNSDYKVSGTTSLSCATTKEATITITDGTNIPENKIIGFNATPVVIYEPDGGLTTQSTIKVNLPEGITSSSPIQVQLSIAGTASKDVDYTVNDPAAIINNGYITIPANTNSASFTITALEDLVVEGDETILITGIAPAGFTMSTNEVAVTIKDRTPGDIIIEKVNDASEPDIHGAFKVRFAKAGVTTLKNVKVLYELSGKAANGTDYETLPGMVIIPAGQTEVLIPVNVINNFIVDGTRNVMIKITSVVVEEP